MTPKGRFWNTRRRLGDLYTIVYKLVRDPGRIHQLIGARACYFELFK